MKRRQWLGLAGRVGLAALASGCASPQGRAEINAAAVARLGGAGYGIWKGGQLVAERNLGGRMPSYSITKSLAALAVVGAVGEGWLDLDDHTSAFPS